MFADVDPLPYVHLSTPNRSLGVEARRCVLAGIAATTFGVAAGAAALGAWPVMPFAGLEIAALAFAFHVLGKHDADFERLEVGEHEVRLEWNEAGHVARFVAHRPWVRVLMGCRGDRCTLRLLYRGRVVPIGRMLSDEGRRRLAEDLRGRIPLRETEKLG
jgi:uncharacterized membrane protein